MTLSGTSAIVLEISHYKTDRYEINLILNSNCVYCKWIWSLRMGIRTEQIIHTEKMLRFFRFLKNHTLWNMKGFDH